MGLRIGDSFFNKAKPTMTMALFSIFSRTSTRLIAAGGLAALCTACVAPPYDGGYSGGGYGGYPMQGGGSTTIYSAQPVYPVYQNGPDRGDWAARERERAAMQRDREYAQQMRDRQQQARDRENWQRQQERDRSQQQRDQQRMQEQQRRERERQQNQNRNDQHQAQRDRENRAVQQSRNPWIAERERQNRENDRKAMQGQ